LTTHSVPCPNDHGRIHRRSKVARLSKLYGDRLKIQLDVADRELIERQRWRAFADAREESAALDSTPLCNWVSPLVVQDDGWVVPIQYGFDTGYAIGRLEEGPFRTQAARWKRERSSDFFALCRNTWVDLRSSPAHLPFTNWYAAITRASVRKRPESGSATLRVVQADAHCDAAGS
jgi:hypothetical protein